MRDSVPNILIGTSGWGYDEWVGSFYPKGLSNKEFLDYYAEIYYTNEINTTFYNIPSEYIVKNWVEKTPDDFVFTAKLPKDITHTYKLNIEECYGVLSMFLDVMRPMVDANKLLAFLIQLPPSFRKDEHFGNLKEFIANWPEDTKEKGYYLAVEFRHKSWMEDLVFDYLKKAGLSYCGVIEPLLPPRMDVTNPDFAYIRFHGYGEKPWFNYEFSAQQIKDWAEKLREVIKNTKRIGIYFNNHFSGYAAKNSLEMMKELNIKPRKNPQSINILKIKKKSGTISKGQTSLDKFFSRR